MGSENAKINYLKLILDFLKIYKTISIKFIEFICNYFLSIKNACEKAFFIFSKSSAFS